MVEAVALLNNSDSDTAQGRKPRLGKRVVGQVLGGVVLLLSGVAIGRQHAPSLRGSSLSLIGEVILNVMTVDGDDIAIVAEGVDTIDNLVSKLSDKTGVPPEGLSLQCWGCKEEGKELQGDSSLDDAGIDSSSRVFMAKRMDCPRGPGAGGGSRAVASRRVSKERNQVSKDCRDVASFSRHSSDPMTWHLNLKGPAGSPYDGGNFPVTVSFPSSYPLKPPSLTFDTPVYHLNVESDGHVCFPYVSREGYRPRASVCSILQAVSAVLESPDLENAARPDLAVLFKENKAEYLENAKASVES